MRGDPGRPDHPDYYGGKGWATLELMTDARARGVRRHPPARPLRETSRTSTARSASARSSSWGSRRASCGIPVVALGDFNFTDTDPEHAILTGLTGLRDVAAELATAERDGAARAIPTARTAASRIAASTTCSRATAAHAAVVARSAQRVFDEPLELDGDAASCSNHAGVLAELEIVPGAGAADCRRRALDAIALATQILREGRRETKQRRRGDRAWAGVGLGAAALASLGVRDPRVSRRRLLRTALQAGALLALTPGVGLSIVSELLTPEELRAFDQLAVRLTRLRVDPAAAHSA